MNETWNLEKWFPHLTPVTHQKLTHYRDILMKFNQTINLVSESAIQVLDSHHFADSILASEIIHGSVGDREIYDLGSGNGFPGIVYAILYPNAPVIAVDADLRKSEFLKAVGFEIKLTNFRVMNQSIDQLTGIELAMCRGLSNVPKALLNFRKVFKIAGELWMLKGEEWVTEISSIPSQLLRAWEAEFVSSYQLPESETVLAIIRAIKKAD